MIRHSVSVPCRTPGFSCWKVCRDLADETNVLIAGCAGSGKSEFLHSCIYAIVDCFLPCKDANSAKLILCDPKRVELSQWADLPHTIKYADTYDGIIDCLDYCIGLMEYRYAEMKKRGLKKWDGSRVYVIIDELADLMITNRKAFSARLTKLMQLSRAAGIHVIACTQSPSRAVLPSSFTLNFSASVGLRCKSAIESRQAIGVPGCEQLPRYGTGYLSNADGIRKVAIPMTASEDIERLMTYWRCKR